MTIIQLPDGQNAEFPNDMPMDQIKAVIQKKYPPTQPQQQPGLLQQAADFVQPINDFGAGFRQGISNVPSDALNFARWGTNKLTGLDIPEVPRFDWAPHNIASSLGGLSSIPIGIGSLSKLPEFAHTATAAMKMPLIAEGLQKAMNTLGKYPKISALAANSLLGGASSPDHELLGMILGAAGPYVGKALQKAYGVGKNAVNTVKDIYREASQPLVQHDLPEVPNLPQMQNIPPPQLPQMDQFPEAQLPKRPDLPQLKLPESDKIPTMADHVPTAPGAGNDLLEKLGQGSSNKEESATKLASLIREKHDQRLSEAGQFFEYPLQKAGNEKLYTHVDPLISTALDKEKEMLGRLKDLNVGSLYASFKKSPTINNAHLLKSELGSVIGDLESNTAKTASDRATLSNIRNVRKKLENDIADGLERHDNSSNENIAPMYQRGVNFYREHVAPYLSSPGLREITRSRIQTPKDIESLFHTPTDFEKGGKINIGPINKIMSDLPPEAKDLVLFNKIGATKYADSHEKLLNALMSAKNEGYSSYFNPHVEEAMTDISNKSKNDILNKKSLELRHNESVKQKEIENKNAITEAKAEHARKTSDIKNAHFVATKKALLAHKNLTKDIESVHKLAVKNALLEHKSNASALQEQHKLAIAKAKLEHKLATDRVKNMNALNAKKIADAKFKRNAITGAGIVGASTLLGGRYAAHKINSLRDVLGED